MGGNSSPLERGLFSGKSLVLDKELVVTEPLFTSGTWGVTEDVLGSPMSTSNGPPVFTSVEDVVSGSLVTEGEGLSHAFSPVISISEFPEGETVLVVVPMAAEALAEACALLS